MYYTLDKDGNPVLEPDLTKWSEWFETTHGTNKRVVEKTQIGDIEVSTIFLGTDHNFGGGDVPILWETMVFGGKLDGEGNRYSTKKEALAGHQAMCKLVKESLL